jgi:tetratricopeptide (TPR) repeat protein
MPSMTLPDFDKLWDYAHPDETERKFRAILPQAREANDPSYLAQLLTQIARTQGLQQRFYDAHRTLDEVEAMLTDDLKLARVRYWLEQGRVFNSSGDRVRAMARFAQACLLAQNENFSRYAIDAMHMLAIAESDPAKQVELNLHGIAMVEKDPSQRGWLWSLYNNIAESYATLKDYQSALDYTRKLIEFQKERGEPDIYTLKDEARFLRHMGHPDQSLAIIEPLVQRQPDDGWLEEELAESLHALGRHSEAHPHFVKAYELLSKDPWCIKNEQTKLERLKNLAPSQPPHS